MKSKHPLKSKTLLFIVATALALIFNIAGPSEKPIAEMTWRELEQRQDNQMDRVWELLPLLGLGGAFYGRVVAKDKIGGKKDA